MEKMVTKALCMQGQRSLSIQCQRSLCIRGFRSLIALLPKLNLMHSTENCQNGVQPLQFNNSVSSRKVFTLSTNREQCTLHVLETKFLTVKKCEASKHDFSTEAKMLDGNHSLIKTDNPNESRNNTNHTLSRTDNPDGIRNHEISWPTDKIIDSLSDEEKVKFNRFKQKLQFDYGLGYVNLPQNMTDEMWSKVIKADSKSSKYKILKKYLNKEKKRLEKAEEMPLRKDRPINVEEQWLNTSIGLISSTKNRWRHFRLLSAMLHDLPVVIDMSYEHTMDHKDISNLKNQFHSSFHNNGVQQQFPFHLLCCNISKDSEVTKYVSKFENFVSSTEKNYLDLYPKDKLVYLSPFSQNMLKEFNDDHIYIVGGYSSGTGHHCSKIVQQNVVKTARFPMELRSLSDYNFNLEDVLEILMLLKMKGDWPQVIGEFYRRHPNYIQQMRKAILPGIKALLEENFPDVRTSIEHKERKLNDQRNQFFLSKRRQH